MTNYFTILSPNIKRGFRAITIFEVKENRLIYIGQAKYQPASTSGPDTEAMHWLIKNGHLVAPDGYNLHSNCSEFFNQGNFYIQENSREIEIR